MTITALHRLLLTTSVLCGAGLSTSALAQQAAASPVSGGLDEIVVTAQRRAESAQSVPIAISAFSPEQLQTRGVTNTLDVGQFVPNLVAQNNTGLASANAYYLRGLGTAESIPTFDPPVGTYVDDIYLSRQNANNLSLFDIERVEVLRGPQGTLFGRNTTGGAIIAVMRQPGDTFGGYAEIGYGRYNKRQARASIDVPLAESFAIKLSGYWQNDRGYVKNVTTGQRLNDDDGWGVRVGARGDMADWARWSGSYTHIVSNGENILNFKCNPAQPTECKGRFATTGLLAGKTAAVSPYLPLVIQGRKANFLMGNRTSTDLVISDFELDLGENITFNAITGFVNQTQQYALDFYDGRSGPSLANPIPPVRGYTRGGFTILNDGSHDQISQEFKINGSIGDGLVDFVAGAFYLVENNLTDFADIFSSSFVGADRMLRNQAESYAGYLQADYNVTEQIKLTAGIRYTDETKKLSISDNRPSCNDGSVEPTCLTNENLVGPNGTPIPEKLKAKLWTPRFAVNYQPTDDLLLFASATRGFKSGGWNARGTSIASFVPFGPEKVWSYEAGLKSEWFDKRVRANLTFFWLDVADLQTPAGFANATGGITFITRNFADYRNRGVEAELTFLPTRGLNLYVNAGYQKDKYIIDRSLPDFDRYGIKSVNAQQRDCLADLAAGIVPTGAGNCGAGIVAADGSIASPVRSPKFTLSMGASYEIELGASDLTLVPAVNASHRSKQQNAASNYTIWTGPITGTNGTFPANPNGGEFITGAYGAAAWFVNAGLTLNGPEAKWSLALTCSNCLNEAAANTALANTTYINPPMMWNVRARYAF